jgi:hypothetical protein
MGYRGKLAERQQARLLRRTGLHLAEIDRLLAEGRARIGRLSEREFLIAGVALYAGEGSKGGRKRPLHEQRSADGGLLLRLAAALLRDR